MLTTDQIAVINLIYKEFDKRIEVLTPEDDNLQPVAVSYKGEFYDGTFFRTINEPNNFEWEFRGYFKRDK